MLAKVVPSSDIALMRLVLACESLLLSQARQFRPAKFFVHRTVPLVAHTTPEVSVMAVENLCATGEGQSHTPTKYPLQN
jgi:hypothetical protein